MAVENDYLEQLCLQANTFINEVEKVKKEKERYKICLENLLLQFAKRKVNEDGLEYLCDSGSSVVREALDILGYKNIKYYTGSVVIGNNEINILQPQAAINYCEEELAHPTDNFSIDIDFDTEFGQLGKKLK